MHNKVILIQGMMSQRQWSKAYSLKLPEVKAIKLKSKIFTGSDKYSNFVKIILKVTDKVLFDVFFSRVYGDHRTYVGIEDFDEEYGHKIAS